MTKSCETVHCLLEVSQDLVQVTSPSGIFLYVNASWQAALGYSQADLRARIFFELLSEADYQNYLTAVQAFRTSRRLSPLTVHLPHKSGRRIALQGYLYCESLMADSPTLWIIWQRVTSPAIAPPIISIASSISCAGPHRPVFNQRQPQRPTPMNASLIVSGTPLPPQEASLRALFGQTGVGIYQLEPLTGRYLNVNQRFCDLVGYRQAELLQLHEPDITYPKDIQTSTKAYSQLLKGELSCLSLEKRYLCKDGSRRWAKLTLSPIQAAQGQPAMILGIVEDIGELTRERLRYRKTAEAALAAQQKKLADTVQARTAALQREIKERSAVEQQLFQEKELAQITLHSIGDGVITTNAKGQVEYLNPAAERLTGWQLSTAQSRLLSAVFQVIDSATRTPVINPLAQVLQEDGVVTLGDRSVLLARNGQEYGIDCSAAPIHNRSQEIIGVVIVFRDVTQSRQLTQKLSWQATHDALTGLVNRAQFEHEITKALRSIQPDSAHPVLCFLDLDRFKIVNDTCGHGAGDELLRQISNVIKQQVRTSDIVARLGGDEFGLLLQDCDLKQAQLIANDLREAVHAFRFVWENKSFGIGVSIGLVTLEDSDQTLFDVLSAADAACYAAKDSGRNRVHIYQLNDAELAQQRSARQWSLRLKDALAQDRFCLYWQPIIATNLAHRSQQHQEVLLRMIDEQGSLVLPGAFLPSAERYGLMPEIDQWVIQSFIHYRNQQPLTFNPKSPYRLYMLNLSGHSISDSYFCDWLSAQLERQPSLSRQLCFEITETTAITNLNQATELMTRLKKLGCHFALDDFGGGLSCFESLKELPLDYLKIDGKFIENIDHNPTTYAIVEAINHVGHVLGIETIAEFVNRPEIQRSLQQIGVDYVQGYTIARPQPLIVGVSDEVSENLSR
jgi:diguanylate cyclase (GGDEF)-like protein/PAS domain S-box-containing protein